MRDEALIRGFLAMLVAERGAAKNTLLAYERDLAEYAHFLHCQGSSLLQNH